MKSKLLFLWLLLGLFQPVSAQNILPGHVEIPSVILADSQRIEARSTITADGDIQVLGKANVSWLAGDTVTLSGGFQAKAGSHFYAGIRRKSDSLINHQAGQNSLLSLYPNPSSGVFIVSLPNISMYQDAEMEVRDAWGRVIVQKYQVNTRNSSVQVDLSNQPSGIYFLFLGPDNGKANLVGKLLLMK